MKLAICLCLVLLQLTDGDASLLTQNDATLIRDHASGRSKAAPNAESLIQGRQRPLFARRVYQQQRVFELRPRVHPVHPKGPPPKVAQIPDISKCYEVSASCLPHSRCCDPCASCHCRFFNSICFCRRINQLCGKEA